MGISPFGKKVARGRRDSMFFAPPGGESLANVVLRLDMVLAELNTLCPNKSVLVCCHGEVNVQPLHIAAACAAAYSTATACRHGWWLGAVGMGRGLM